MSILQEAEVEDEVRLWNMKCRAFTALYNSASSPSDEQLRTIITMRGVAGRVLCDNPKVGARIRVFRDQDYYRAMRNLVDNMGAEDLKTVGLLGKQSDFYPIWSKMSREVEFFVLIPYFWKGRVCYIRAWNPTQDGELRWPASPVKSPYRVMDLKNHKNVAVFESEIDCMRAMNTDLPDLYDTGVIGVPNWTGRNKNWAEHFQGKCVWLVKRNDEKSVAFCNLAQELHNAADLVVTINAKNIPLDDIPSMVKEDVSRYRAAELRKLLSQGIKKMRADQAADIMEPICKKWNANNLRSWATATGLSTLCKKGHHKLYNIQDFAYVALLQIGGYRMSEIGRHMPYDPDNFIKINGVTIVESLPEIITIPDYPPDKHYMPSNNIPDSLEVTMKVEPKPEPQETTRTMSIPYQDPCKEQEVPHRAPVKQEVMTNANYHLMIEYIRFMDEKLSEILNHNDQPNIKAMLNENVHFFSCDVESPISNINESLVTISESIYELEQKVVQEAFRKGFMTLK